MTNPSHTHTHVNSPPCFPLNMGLHLFIWLHKHTNHLKKIILKNLQLHMPSNTKNLHQASVIPWSLIGSPPCFMIRIAYNLIKSKASTKKRIV